MKSKDILSIAGVKSATMANEHNLPMLVFFHDKEYIIKSTKNGGLMMVKNELLEERETETKDPRDEN